MTAIKSKTGPAVTHISADFEDHPTFSSPTFIEAALA